MNQPARPPARIPVPAGLHTASRFFAATAGLWRRLGDLETRVLGDELEGTGVRAPVYVTSLARAGTTIVTEFLAGCEGVTSHRYSDFPNVWTPYWRNHLLARSRAASGAAPEAVERAHGDRIRITQDSPEAVEEVLWTHFFDDLHDPSHSNVLSGEQRNVAFDAFYRDHIRKLLLVRGAERYLAKGNYNITRLAYLARLFPDARFVIPVRHPLNHIASLAKQHRLFSEASAADPRVGRQLGLAGHWEFGPGRTVVHCGDQARVEAIQAAWAEGQEVRGWALYWDSIYSFLLKQISDLKDLRDKTLIFRYESLCGQPEATLEQILAHAGYDAKANQARLTQFAGRLSAPDYYQPDFSAEELGIIRDCCSETALQLGYELG